jgi:hypothetical protein
MSQVREELEALDCLQDFPDDVGAAWGLFLATQAASKGVVVSSISVCMVSGRLRKPARWGFIGKQG